MLDSLLFGDIFRYQGNDYVYLAETEDVRYAAKILDVDQSAKLDRAANGPRKTTSLVYSYVKLSTKEFENRCAHTGLTGKEAFTRLVDKLNVELDEVDKKAIYKEIVEGPVPTGLKKLLADVEI